jgi:uncharacterized MAPEG superfamily protein
MSAVTIAFWCVLAAGILPLPTVALAKWGRRDYNNSEPRAWLERLQGMRRRADYAHRNHFEAFPFFAAGVIIATLAHAPQDRIDALAMGFIGLRVIYTGLYVGDVPSLRSACWLLAYLCVVAQFWIAARA